MLWISDPCIARICRCNGGRHKIKMKHLHNVFLKLVPCWRSTKGPKVGKSEQGTAEASSEEVSLEDRRPFQMGNFDLGLNQRLGKRFVFSYLGFRHSVDSAHIVQGYVSKPYWDILGTFALLAPANM